MGKPVITKDECSDCGLCASTYAPDVFQMNEDEGVAEVKPMDDYSAHKDAIDEAIENCPTECIAWEE